MASACLNTISPENLLDCPPAYSSYSWFNPRLREVTSSSKKLSDLPEHTDPVPENSDPSDFDGFEFRLEEDPVTMLPADELFSDGKLVPLQMTVKCNERETENEGATSLANMTMITDRCPDTPFRRRVSENNDVFSPRAPRCSSRWKELLGFGNNNNKRATPLASSNANGATRSIRQLLQRNSKASSLSNDASVNVPLLDNETVTTISSRASLSSSSTSSSNHSLDDLPRLSLDSDKPNKSISNTRPKTRMVKTNPRATTRGNRQATRRSTDACETRAANPVTIESPRMNSSGKIVFQHLERSSSSPSSLNGGPRHKHRGVMERSYSANVRITPVLNLNVSKSVGGVFGFPIFSSSGQQNKQNVTNRSQRFNGKSKTDNGFESMLSQINVSINAVSW